MHVMPPPPQPLSPSIICFSILSRSQPPPPPPPPPTFGENSNLGGMADFLFCVGDDDGYFFFKLLNFVLWLLIHSLFHWLVGIEFTQKIGERKGNKKTKTINQLFNQYIFDSWQCVHALLYT
jgi:hypothetical protein